MDKIKNLGQVYTPIDIAIKMFNLSVNKGKVLEPSCGEGVFVDYIKDKREITSIEIDILNKKDGVLIMDFFEFSEEYKFDTIIGNPPYVSFNNISSETRELINKKDYLNYDNRTNLYIHFIRKSIEHLTENGELIFITPREFIKATSSINLNNFLYENGTITHWFEYGDKVLFKGYNPNVVIWRFEKNNFNRETITNDGIRKFNINSGQLSFINNEYNIKFSDIFFVKVGAVSGMDSVFTNELGNVDFVCSYTKKTNKLKRMFYNIKHESLNKELLLTRKIKKFNDDNWFCWGRGLYLSNKERIYVNCKTRDNKPFFTNDSKYYDGSVLAIFPKKDININLAIDMLNSVNWSDLGFIVGGRLCFTQKSLENTNLPNNFTIFV